MKKYLWLCLVFLTGCSKFFTNQSAYPSLDVSRNSDRILISSDALVTVRPTSGSSSNYTSSLPTFQNIASVIAPSATSSTSDVQATATVLSGNYAYISYNMSGDEVFGAIDVVNIADPAAPVIEYTYTSSDFEFSDLRVKGNYLLLSGYRKESAQLPPSAILMVLDISSKVSPLIKKVVDVPGIYATSMDLLNNQVLVNTGTTGGLYKYDVSNPENPTLVSSVVRQNGLYAKLGAMLNYSLSGTSNTNFEAIGQTVGSLPVPVNSTLTIAPTQSEAPSRFVRQNALVYLNNTQSHKLHILDLSQVLRSTISELSNLPLLGTANGLAQDQQRLYVAQGEKGVYVIDVSNPNAPQVMGNFDFDGDSGSANNIWIEQNTNGKFYFLADGRQGIRILKENTAAPVQSSTISFYARGMDYDGAAVVKVKVNGEVISTINVSGSQFELYNVQYSRILNDTDVVEVVFTNDKYDGTWATDRNAMIAFLKVNGNYCYIKSNSPGEEDIGLFNQLQTLSATQTSCNTTVSAQVCSPNQDKSPTEACALPNNHSGKLVCDSSGLEYKCQDTGACQAGYTLNNGVCIPQVCSPNSTTDCSDSVSVRHKTCNVDGLGYGSCQLDSCKSGNTLVNGECVPQICSPNSSTTCSINNGSGTKTCNSTGTQYGSCSPTTCNAGYFLNNGVCVAQVCSPNSTQSCTFLNAIGVKTCDLLGSGFGLCVTGSTCEAGYHPLAGLCLPNTCSPNSTTSCSVNNGTGSKTCDSIGSGYGSCTVAACNSGFYQNGNTCVAQTCTPNSTQSCVNNHLVGTQTCNANGSALGSCTTSTTCEAGYYYSNGSCLPQTCTPNSSSSCSGTNGTGSHTCNSTGSGYGSCVITSCNPGSYLDNGVCVAQVCAPSTVQACVSNHLIGTQTCNSNGSAFGTCNTTNICEVGYFFSNGQCVAQSCSPNTTIACAESNGTGTKTCNSEGSSYGSCSITSCNVGFNKKAVPGNALTYCATENQNCEFLGTVDVQYGINGQYNTKSITNGTACTNEVFEDSFVGLTKECYIKGSFACEAQVCAPNSISTCTVNNGVGTKTCNTTGSAYGSCQVTACNVGYYNNNGTCTAQTCTPNSTNSCVTNHQIGVQTCNALGSGVGLCVAVGTTCEAGYNYANGSCQANVCSPLATTSCQVNNGTGTHTCNATGSAYGSCVTTSCNAGFYNNNGTCTAQTCSPLSTQSCTSNNFLGTKTCNATGSGYGSCVTGMTCESGYYNNGVSCVPLVCQPGSSSSCSADNGTGTKICNTVGSGYGSCTVNQCNAGFNLVNGTCVAQVCSPNASVSCSDGNGSGTKTCNSTGTAYGSCGITTCNSGYYFSNGSCVAQTCAPNSSATCSVTNGTGSKTCNATGSAYGSCSVATCNSGYTLSGGVCVASTNSCTVPNGTGTQSTYGASSGIAVTHELNSDYGSGYGYQLRLSNNGSTQIQGWSVCFTYNYNITNPSNADITASSAKPNWQFVPKSYNKIIYPGSNVTMNWNSSPGYVGSDRLTNIKVFNSSTASCSDTPVWSSGPVCVATSCNANYHLESGQCVSNTRSCTVPNGTGSQTWSNGSWGACKCHL